MYTTAVKMKPDIEHWLTKHHHSVFVIIPTYNESQNISSIVQDIFSLFIPNLHIVIVDDNSPDGTGVVADTLAHTFSPRIHVIHRPYKQGLGKAYLHGFRYAIQNGADYIIQMDADFSHSPKYIPSFLQAIQSCDLVIGSRYITGGKLDPKWSIFRNGLSRWANCIYLKLFLGLNVNDGTAGFKCWKRKILATLIEYPISAQGYFFQVEMAYLAQKLGFDAREIPIYFEDRHKGKSKMSNAIKLEAVWRTWSLRWRYRNLKTDSTTHRLLEWEPSKVEANNHRNGS